MKSRMKLHQRIPITYEFIVFDQFLKHTHCSFLMCYPITWHNCTQYLLTCSHTDFCNIPCPVEYTVTVLQLMLTCRDDRQRPHISFIFSSDICECPATLLHKHIILWMVTSCDTVLRNDFEPAHPISY